MEILARPARDVNSGCSITRDSFSLFVAVQRNPAAQTVLVYSPIARRLPFALPRGAASGRARTSHRSWEPTVTVGGVRAYTSGDPLKERAVAAERPGPWVRDLTGKVIAYRRPRFSGDFPAEAGPPYLIVHLGLAPAHIAGAFLFLVYF